MKHITCGECGSTFSHATIGSCRQALALHTQRVHTRVTTPPGTGGTPPYNGGKSEAPEVDRIERRGKWKRKPKALHVGVNFCPQCGCNMQSVAVGIAMASK